MKNLKTYQIFLFFLLLFITAIIFIPVINADYAVTDDSLMLKSYDGELKNLSLKYIYNIFMHSHEKLYHPLVTLSYSFEKTLFGMLPAVFHFDNIILHLINIVLVFLIFFKLSKNNYWTAFIVTVLFALHPTRVETVAWISARKDLLYASFYLLSILFYLKYTDKKTTTLDCYAGKLARNDRQEYFHTSSLLYLYTSIFFFLLSCFSKSMAITLPFILILIDYYTGIFDKRKIKKYIPYFFITVTFVFIGMRVHYSMDFVNYNLNIFNCFTNFINAHFNILFYFDKLLLPINLYCLYPYFYDMTKMPPWFILFSPVVLYLLTYFSFLSLKKYKIKLIFFGFMFFLITLVPVCGLLPVGCFVVADRYTYIPYLGLFYIFAKIIVFMVNKKKVLSCFNLISHNISKSVNLYFCISVIVCILCFFTLSFLSYKRVLDWEKGMYGPPRLMKYYEFGIKKKSKNWKHVNFEKKFNEQLKRKK